MSAPRAAARRQADVPISSWSISVLRERMRVASGLISPSTVTARFFETFTSRSWKSTCAPSIS